MYVCIQVAHNPRFRYFGNVHVGVDIKLSELSKIYPITVLAYGSSGDRHLGIPGEDLQGIRLFNSDLHFISHFSHSHPPSLIFHITTIPSSQYLIVLSSYTLIVHRCPFCARVCRLVQRVTYLSGLKPRLAHGKCCYFWKW